MVEAPPQQLCWQIDMPRLGFTYHFIMRQIFAVAALHKCHALREKNLPADQSLVNLADTHMNTALAEFRSEFQNITRENCGALMGFSCMIIVYLCAATQHGLSPFVPVSGGMQSMGMVEWFQLAMIGMKMLWASETRAWIFESPIGNLWPKENWPEDIKPRNAEEICADTKLARLQSLWTTEESAVEKPPFKALSATQIESLSTALQQLRISYLRASLAAEMPGRVRDESEDLDHTLGRRGATVAWIYEVDETFMALLQEKNPCALIVLAHYAALLSKVRYIWWLDGLADDMMDFAASGLEGHMSWIEEPMKEIRLSDSNDSSPQKSDLEAS
jgi:hypothetical protein